MVLKVANRPFIYWPREDTMVELVHRHVPPEETISVGPKGVAHTLRRGVFWKFNLAEERARAHGSKHSGL